MKKWDGWMKMQSKYKYITICGWVIRLLEHASIGVLLDSPCPRRQNQQKMTTHKARPHVKAFMKTPHGNPMSWGVRIIEGKAWEAKMTLRSVRPRIHHQSWHNQNWVSKNESKLLIMMGEECVYHNLQEIQWTRATHTFVHFAIFICIK
jgi:hypothetical protein